MPADDRLLANPPSNTIDLRSPSTKALGQPNWKSPTMSPQSLRYRPGPSVHKTLVQLTPRFKELSHVAFGQIGTVWRAAVVSAPILIRNIMSLVMGSRSAVAAYPYGPNRIFDAQSLSALNRCCIWRS